MGDLKIPSLSEYQMTKKELEPTQTITVGQYYTFYHMYFDNADDQKLRFGQAFCNMYAITDSELYYQEKPHAAINIILDRYIKEN